MFKGNSIAGIKLAAHIVIRLIRALDLLEQRLYQVKQSHGLYNALKRSQPCIGTSCGKYRKMVENLLVYQVQSS